MSDDLVVQDYTDAPIATLDFHDHEGLRIRQPATFPIAEFGWPNSDKPLMVIYARDGEPLVTVEQDMTTKVHNAARIDEAAAAFWDAVAAMAPR